MRRRRVAGSALAQQREHDDDRRAERCEREQEDEDGAAASRSQAATIPAPTVSFVPSSMRTNAPVTRLAGYGSTASGRETRRRTRPMSLSMSPAGAAARSGAAR